MSLFPHRHRMGECMCVDHKHNRVIPPDFIMTARGSTKWECASTSTDFIKAMYHYNIIAVVV